MPVQEGHAMRTSLRAVIALAISVGAILTAVTASASNSAPRPPETPVGSGPGVAGGTCLVDHPDCNDIGFGGGPSDPGQVPEPKPQIVEPRPGMANVTPTVFDTATIGADDVTLAITFWGGVEPCSVLDHVDVAESSTAVTVTLSQGNDPTAGDVACPEIAMLKQVNVTLDHPLDGRDIVDGAAS
jgi:hypothetical protein